MKAIVVGDIHGHVDSVEAALAFDGKTIFVGDYLDSFNQPVENQIRCLTMVMDAIEDNPDKTVGLLGNHEMSYLDQTMRCSGYNPETQTYVDHLRERMLSLLGTYHWEQGVLVSHAGVSKKLLFRRDQELGDYLSAGDFNQIGYFRGGYDPVGGLFWCDFREIEPIPGVVQVVGHTASKGHSEVDGVREFKQDGGTVWCVDNLDRKKEVLLIEDGVCSPYELES